MPNCFSLTRKGDTKPSSFIEIDEEICKLFNAPVDPVKYYRGWYDFVGLSLATGKSLQYLVQVCRDYLAESEIALIAGALYGEPCKRELRSVADDRDLLKLVEWLSEHYESNAWYQSR